jgi:aspartyl-tRNA(Asn)/glutamyl-tRNA(Gln) amidotransferase subunit A
MSAELLDFDLVGLARAIRTKKISSAEATKASLARAERVQPALNCFIRIEAEQVLKAARRADAALARKQRLGPLHGVPLAHKDMFYRAGKPCTCGSKIRRDYLADTDSTALKRLLDAGSLYLGGLNMSEFAVGPTGLNAHHGHCRNPWNPAHVTGGSSSGSGSAVAARIVTGALGSDTGGSIRLPAAMCGLVGMKTTAGLVSRFGAMPLSHSLDTIGPLTRTVRDNALLLKLIAGPDPNDPTTVHHKAVDYEAKLAGSLKGLRIAVPEDYYYDVASDEIRHLMEESLAVFRSLGARLVRVRLPNMATIAQFNNLVLAAEGAAFHEPWLLERPGDYQDQVRGRLEIGFYVPAPKYLAALRARGPLLAAFCEAAFAKADVLHAPTVPVAVPKLDEIETGAGQAMLRMVSNISWCTRVANFLGVPALSVPCGFTENGLPTGFQLIGRPFSEALLYRAGHGYQRAAGWTEQRPAL